LPLGRPNGWWLGGRMKFLSPQISRSISAYWLLMSPLQCLVLPIKCSYWHHLTSRFLHQATNDLRLMSKIQTRALGERFPPPRRIRSRSAVRIRIRTPNANYFQSLTGTFLSKNTSTIKKSVKIRTVFSTDISQIVGGNVLSRNVEKIL